LLRRHSIAESCHRPNQNIRHLIRANRLERLNGLYRIVSGGVVEKLVKSATVHLVFQPANQRVHAFLLHYRTSTFWNPNPYSIAVTVDRAFLLAASRMPSSSAAFCNSACARALVSLSRSLSACTKRPVDRTYTRVCWLSIVVTNTCDGGSTRRTVRTAPFSMICTSSGFIWLMSTPAMVCPRTIINSRSPASRSGSTALDLLPSTTVSSEYTTVSRRLSRWILSTTPGADTMLVVRPVIRLAIRPIAPLLAWRRNRPSATAPSTSASKNA